MGNKTNRKSVLTKAWTSSSKQNTAIKQAAKKKRQQWSKDRSERLRDALNRDADLLYNALENPSIIPSPIPQTDLVVSLVESMQGLGR